MTRRLHKVARLLAIAALAVTSLALAGCPDNPYAPETWAKKLGDPHEIDTAVEKLENLGSPKGIKPLGEAWLKNARPPRILQVIIELARPLTKDEAGKKFLSDFPEGRPASWDLALPYLISALKDADETNPRSVDSAIKAAEAIGSAGLEEGMEALIEFANRPPTKKMIQAQVAAVRALGFFSGNRKQAVTALMKLVDRDPPPNPRTVKDQETRRTANETFQRFLAITGNAIISLGTLRAPEATEVLVLAIYRTPELFGQVRRALTASGGGAVAELRKVLRDEQPRVKQLFKDKKLDKYCGDRGDLPPDQCVEVSARVFYAAVVLGDMYDPSSVPDLLAALKEPAKPAYFFDEQPSGTQHSAIFDALRKIGAEQAAAPLLAIWTDSKADITERLGAIGAYSFTARDDSAVDKLTKIIEDNDENGNLRLEAAATYGRLARGAGAIPLMQSLAVKYGKESAEDRAKADGEPKKTMEKAQEKVKQARKAREEAKANLEKLTRDPNVSAEQIRAATEAATAKEEAFKEADKKQKDDSAKFYALDRNAKDRHSYQRSFQSHIARIEIAMRCKGDAAEACYAASLKAKPEEVIGRLGAYIKDFKDWTPDEKAMLVSSQIERAMLELGKLGQKAGGQKKLLLDTVKSDDRITRQSILLALPKVVKVPCDDCEAKLDEAIKAGAGKSTMTELNDQTEMLRNYFSWAGGKAPSSKPAAPAEAPAEAGGDK